MNETDPTLVPLEVIKSGIICLYPTQFQENATDIKIFDRVNIHVEYTDNRNVRNIILGCNVHINDYSNGKPERR